jgi:hypothetical protein
MLMSWRHSSFNIQCSQRIQPSDEAARENLARAIEILSECRADGWVEKYEKELAALS